MHQFIGTGRPGNLRGRIDVGAVILLFWVLFSGQTAFADMKGYDFNIPSQKVGNALDEFADVTRYSLLYSLKEIGTVMTREVSGRYAADQALSIMLDGTDLIYEKTGPETIAIRKKSDTTQPGAEEEGTALPETEKGNEINQMDDPLGGEPVGDYTFEDTVVTASKREVKSQSIPMSIQALKGDRLEKTGVVNIEDFVNDIPGLTISPAGGGLNSLQIRGISTFANTVNASSTVGFYIDDTPISSPTNVPDFGMFDLERVEVLKGPQGTLYGEGSLGGTVRLITRKPQLDGFEGKVQLSTSQTKNAPDLNYQANAMINAPLVNDRLALRVSANFNDDAGYTDDANSGDEGTNFSRKKGFRASLLWEPNEKLSILPRITYQKLDGGGGAWDSPLYPDLTHYREMTDGESLDDENTILSLTVEYDLDWAVLTSNTSYYDRNFTSATDKSEVNATLNTLIQGLGIYSPYTIQDVALQEETFTQEIRLVSPDTGPWNWVVGLFYRDRALNNDVILNNDQIGFVNELVYGQYNDRVFTNETEQTSKHIAMFGELNYNILENLVVTGGLRWFREEIVGDSLYETRGLNGLELSGDTTHSELTENDVMYKLAISHNPAENIMLYTQFTQGIRPGGTNDRAVDFGLGGPVVPVNFESDKTDNYEAGIKSDWFNGRFRANLAAFYIDWKNVQVEDLGAFGQSFIVNAGRASSTGVELELAARPMEGLTLGFAMSYTEAKTTEETTTANGTIPDGATLPWAPEWSGSLSAEYAFPIFQDMNAFVSGDIQFMDEQYTAIQVGSDPGEPLDAYQTVNLRVGVSKGPWSALIFGTNIFNEQAQLNDSEWDLMRYIRNRPRTIGIQLSRSF